MLPYLRMPLGALVASLFATTLGCPGGPATCRTGSDCAVGQACVRMACVPRPPGPDGGPMPDAYLAYPDAVVVDDAWSEPDAVVTPPDAFTPPPDAFAPRPDAGPDAFMVDPCTDGALGAGESDVDCGGPACMPCANGLMCRVPADCATGLCSTGRCGPPPISCTNGTQDGEETATDCGGLSCPPCANGLTCMAPRDCRSSVCVGGVCATPTCTDGAQNGGETDTDCGGGTCPRCADGRICATRTDCVSGVCTGSRCAVPTCSDGVRNGTETDLDCGGSCTACAPGSMCVVPADCDSMTCSAGVCLDCMTTMPRWSPPFTCTDPFCMSSVSTLRPATPRRLEASWGSTVGGCTTCVDTFVLSQASVAAGPLCPSCANATVSEVRVVPPSSLDVTIRAPTCDPCTERLTFTGATVSSSGCTEAACGPQAIRQMRASGDRLELDWGTCACTQTITLTGAPVCM